MAQFAVIFLVFFGFVWSGESRCPKPTLPANPNDKYYQGMLFAMFLKMNASNSTMQGI